MDIPIAGAAGETVQNGKPVSGVALVGLDYVRLSSRLQVAEGDRVILGQTLFTDRYHPVIKSTAPATVSSGGD